MYHYYPQFTDEKSGKEMLCMSSYATLIGSGEVEAQIQAASF